MEKNILIKKNLVHEPSDGFDCISPSRTVQEFKEECDVNNILRNYVSTGVLTHTTNRQPIYGDFTQIPKDYGDMVNIIKDSEEKFALLPSEVRRRFDDNAYNMIKFLEDENNRDEAVKLGLVRPNKVDEDLK